MGHTWGLDSMLTYEELLEENRALKAQVAELIARVAELESRLGRNSRNSFPARQRRTNVGR
jgi:cell division septum initiation protein DivIVA